MTQDINSAHFDWFFHIIGVIVMILKWSYNIQNNSDNHGEL